MFFEYSLERHPSLMFFMMIWASVTPQSNFIDFEYMVPCNEPYVPKYCNFPNITLSSLTTLEDFDRCVPAILPLLNRNFFWSGAGRKESYYRNMRDFKKLQINQHDLQVVSNSDLTTYLLGQKMSSPIGLSPAGGQLFAHPEAEIAAARAAARFGTVLILSSFASSAIEDIVAAATSVNQFATVWMQTYFFHQRKHTLYLVRRAEKARCKALVLTIDSPLAPSVTCDVRDAVFNLKLPNIPFITPNSPLAKSITFDEIAWLKQNTKLPIVAKGIYRASDAIKAAQVGVSAIFVSNHGGRQMDSAPSTISALRQVVKALKYTYPHVEVYMDGGVRNGWDAFKAIASGAKAVFLGRPAIWGLSVGGEAGVYKVLNILKKEFNETMVLAGFAKPSQITSDSVSVNNIE